MKKFSVLVLSFCIIFVSIVFINYTDKVISDSEVIRLNFEVTDSVMDPTKPIIYITDKNNKKLHLVNYKTKETKEITFDLWPESVTYANGEIYVSLLKGNHSSDWWNEDQEGAVAIVDLENFTTVEQFDIDIDPFDIVVDKDEYIYITSGSGQWTYMKSYNRQTKQEIKSTTIRQMSYAKIHPIINRIYTIDTDSSPRDMTAYNILKGDFTDPVYPGGYDSPYHGDYPMGKNFKISPDGKYILNSAGTIFTCNDDKTEDMIYVNSLSKEFTDIAFDINNGRFFTGASDKKIYMYNINNFEQQGTYFSKGEVKNLFFQNNELISISIDDSGYFIENIDINSYLSCDKDITSFSVAGVEGTIRGNEINVKVPIEVNLIDLVSVFESSSLSTVKIGEVTQLSEETKNDFRNPITYTVVAEDGSTKEYTVKVENFVDNSVIKYGDVNFDRQITNEDIELISSFIKEEISFMNIQKIAADVNGDNIISSKDTELIEKYLSGIINKFIVEDMGFMPLYINVTDLVIHPTEPIIYFTDKKNKKLHYINYKTKEFKEISFNLPPESITFANNEIYVCLLKGEHSPYWWDEDQEGAVAIVDSENFTILDQFDIDIDPYDIVADKDGYIYITSGSGQWTYIKSYNRQTKEVITSRGIRQMSYAKIHPTINRIYTINTDSSARDMTAYNILDGSFSDSYDSPYHGEYPMRTNFDISPDGKYIFNGSGTIFNSNYSKNYDMTYVYKLDSPFSDIEFNLDNNKFYTSNLKNQIKVYNYNNYEQIGMYKTKYNVQKLFHRNSELVIISATENNSFFIEVINDSPITVLYDCNLDGKVDESDLVILKESYNLKSTDNNFQSFKDLNSDGVINIYDLVILSKKIK